MNRFCTRLVLASVLLIAALLTRPTTSFPALHRRVVKYPLLSKFIPLIPVPPPAAASSPRALQFSLYSDSEVNCTSPGYTLDPCTSNSECITPRVCQLVSSPDDACPDQPSVPCICAEHTECTSSAECGLGELCILSSDSTVDSVATCLSRKFINSAPLAFQQIDGGLTWDPCIIDEDCQPGRICRRPLIEPPACNDANDCVCDPTADFFCNSHDDCVDGEVCVMADFFDAPLCISRVQLNCRAPLQLFDEYTSPTSSPPASPSPSPSAATTLADATPQATPGAAEAVTPLPTPSATPTLTPSPSSSASTTDTNTSPPSTPAPPDDSGLNDEGTSAVCIDATLLAHLPAEHLVFRTHARSVALCDAAGSCATPGHIVVFGGRAMMMRRYCEVVGCKRREMLVNSPRYRRRWRGASRTEGLHFTAFAARWETGAEETVLAAVVRLGL